MGMHSALRSPMRSPMARAMNAPAPTLLMRAASILRRISNTTDLHLTSVVGTTATSAGPVTIADGGYVEVLSGKTWSIV